MTYQTELGIFVDDNETENIIKVINDFKYLSKI